MTERVTSAGAVQASGGTIVFVHGYMDSAATWGRAITKLKLPGWQAIAATLHTPPERSGASAEMLQRYAAQVQAQVEALALKPDGRVVVVGHSMGGQVAELAACALGERAAGLILVTPAPLAGYPLPPALMERFASRAGLTDLASIRDGKRGLAVSLDEEALEILVQSTVATSRDAALAQLDAWTGGHPAGRAPSPFDGPVLTVSTDDKFFTPELLAEGAQRFRHAAIEHVAGAGHWPQLEQSDALAALVCRFVQSRLPLA